MLVDFGHFILKILASAWNMLNSSSGWMIFSFVIAGVLHEFLKPEKVQKTAIGSSRVSGVFWTTVSGMFIPICSCGTIPLGISMYYSGAYLGPTLAFMTSTPIINPIALLLAFGLLGKEVAVIYLITGFVAPMIIGIAANRFAKDELYIGLKKKKEEPNLAMDTPKEEDAGKVEPMIQLEFEEPGFWEKVKSGLHWSLTELSVTISKYTVTGMLIAGILFNVVPQSFIQDYLGNPGFVSLLGITVIAALMYVCAVGHIPFIAALVASGAAPGVAITFLMAGAGTNIPELLTISKTIGKRAMLMYFGMVAVISNVVGYITNRLLMPGFTPVLNYDQAQHTISYANKMIVVMPGWLQNICSGILVCYALYSLFKIVKAKAGKRCMA
ncbi:efflux transporter SaoE [Extibacter muris]|uniref:efflux transporter SaoE n=1 Tax=Extibacter muris TaxID=1796622 RepID=UPI001D07EB02|nr:efflux transporter SaoE [Extibacter muris]MCB6202319.1 permease [Extibacter muris]MCQ4665187.1 efflux transporter SaoE [Extibacter muris]MCQ4694551.1 efflux transporter SaoE [Extibacter muris]